MRTPLLPLPGEQPSPGPSARYAAGAWHDRAPAPAPVPASVEAATGPVPLTRAQARAAQARSNAAPTDLGRSGRHRPPQPHRPMRELRQLAEESLEPTVRGLGVAAVTGGLVATFSSPASADTQAPGSGRADATAAVVGPHAATFDGTHTQALTAIGYRPGVTAGRPAAPVSIRDVQAEHAQQLAQQQARQQAREAAARDRQRASRDLTRATLTATGTTSKTGTTNPPPSGAGRRAGSNWGSYGYCTWGALQMWYQSEGYYPGGWTGNAKDWNNRAGAAGYTVSTVPRARAFVVMEPGVYGSSASAGHVGWVSAVNGDQVTIVEMNAIAGWGKYDTRTVTHVAGMSYIYAP